MTAKLKVAGTWAGVVEVELEQWTVPMLRAEVARRSNASPDSINLICAGRLLRDGEGTDCLSRLGVKNNSKILSSRSNVNQKQELLAEEERSNRLARVKAAATALADRNSDGSLPLDDYNIELEDQSGKKVNLGSETDQRAVMMGLMLHTKGKQVIQMQKYKDALEVLEMAEEAFSLCNPQVIEMIDNVPILQIDIAWCYFMLRDISSISVAGSRLQKAREGIERAHGKDYTRIRLLQGGRHPEIALHLRLELLEGVVAYHTGQFDNSRNALTSAKAKFLKLQVSDEALTLVMSMGFQERAARRALRMNNHDVGASIEFLVEENAKKQQKREENRRRQSEILEQKSYGLTPLKKAVCLERLNELVSIGFDKALAAESLRRNENDTQKALDDLTDPEVNAKMQQEIESRKWKRQKRAEDEAVEQLVSMGFERSRVEEAVRASGAMERAMQVLLSQNPQDPSNPADTPASSTPAPTSENASGPSNSADEIPASVEPMNERDVEMEGELANDVAQVDALSDYDIDVTKEGEAIDEYFALLALTGGSSSV